MRESEKNVGRADHNPSQRDEEQGERKTVGDSAAKHAHGTHGRGAGGEEERFDPTAPVPGNAKDTEIRGSAGWGSEPSGGSVIDKTSPDR